MFLMAGEEEAVADERLPKRHCLVDFLERRVPSWKQMVEAE